MAQMQQAQQVGPSGQQHQTETLEQVQLMHSGWLQQHRIETLEQEQLHLTRQQEQTMKQTVVPFRNGIMLSIAGGFAESKGAQGLVIAAHSGDHAIYPDCREEFMRSMSDAIRLGTYAEVEVIRPFISMTKAEIAKRGNELGVDFSQTWSCYVGGEAHCGECGTCVERREAFLLAGISDPTNYLITSPLPPKPSAC